MKPLLKISSAVLLAFMTMNVSAQQTVKTTKKQEKAARITKQILDQKYTFEAQYALPLGGTQRYLNSDYDLRVTRDSVIAFLPYFGRVYMDAPYNPTDGGIKFTSTKFDYKIANNKKGGWTITINLHDVERTRQLFLNVYTNGSASLQASSNTRDPISFDGYIEDNKNKDQ